jgi:beta-1,4-N-acetylglucosaminyltransferase
VIFVTVGMHTLGFPRLVRAMDELAATLDEDVVMQIGATPETPQHARAFAFATQAEMERWCVEARVIVSQAGAGSILTAQKARVPLILVPRLRQYGEHIDDHQLELARILQRTGCALLVENMKELAQALERARHFAPAASVHKGQLIGALQSILTQMETGNVQGR